MYLDIINYFKLRDKITTFFRNTQAFSCICQKNVVILRRFANK